MVFTLPNPGGAGAAEIIRPLGDASLVNRMIGQYLVSQFYVRAVGGNQAGKGQGK